MRKSNLWYEIKKKKLKNKRVELLLHMSCYTKTGQFVNVYDIDIIKINKCIYSAYTK